MNNQLKSPYDVVIVGSGYSGTMVAVHLARAQRGLRVALIVQQLLIRDLLAPDPLRIGAYTAEGGYICNREGQVISGLYTLGPTQKGRLYESVAVPELRGQAADLAAHLFDVVAYSIVLKPRRALHDEIGIVRTMLVP